MSVKSRIEKLEAKQPNELIEVAIKRYCNSEPLPEPSIINGVRVSCHYADARNDKPM
jgi:hypothetical protein